MTWTPSKLEGLFAPVVSPDGRVLVASVTGAEELVAYELPTLRELGRATPALGYCGAEAQAMLGGSISPDGAWVYLSGYDPSFGGPASLLIRTEDLRAGRWRPAPVDHDPLLWDTPTTFLATDDTSDVLRYVRCDTSGGCEPVAMPRELGPDAQLVRVVGR